MYRILALDDSNVIRSLVRITLHNKEVQVDSAASVHEACYLAEQHDYHMLIIDYMMPDISGLEFIARLRKMAKYQTTPIIMLTAECSKEIKEEAKALKVTAWVTKPFQPQTLIKLTSQILKSTYLPSGTPKDSDEQRQKA